MNMIYMTGKLIITINLIERSLQLSALTDVKRNNWNRTRNILITRAY